MARTPARTASWSSTIRIRKKTFQAGTFRARQNTTKLYQATYKKRCKVFTCLFYSSRYYLYLNYTYNITENLNEKAQPSALR